MNKWKIRTKIEVGFGIIVVLMLLSISIIPALTRTITSSSDNMETFIRNSNGNYWAATGANLRLAIGDLANTSGTVWLPSGIITGCDDIRLWNNVTIKGAGMYSTTLKATVGCSYGVIYVSEGNDNFSICDLAIDGNDAGIVGQNGIYIRRSRDFVLQNLYIHDTDGNGIFLQSESPTTAIGTCSHAILNNIIMNNENSAGTEPFAFNNVSFSTFNNLQSYNSPNTWAFDFHAVTNSTISNLIVDNSGYGIKLWGEGNSYCSDLVMNNVVINNVDGATGNGLTVSKTNRCSITNVQINESRGMGVDLSSYVQLSNIKIQHAGNVGISITHSNHITMDSATSIDAVSYGFYLHGSNNVSISKLYVVNPANYNLVDTTNDFSISDSTFEKGASYGLLLETATHFSIDSCKILYNVVDGIDTTIATCNNYTISHCYFKGNAKAIDIAATDNYFIVSDCICDPNDGIDINAALSSTRRVNDTICVLTTS